MKKSIVPIMLIGSIILFSCSSTGKMRKYFLNENDASAAIREMLELGVKDETLNPDLSKARIMAAIFPEPERKILNTLQQLGLTNELDKFTADLTTAVQRSTERSASVFISAIDNLSFQDAIQIIKSGGTAATDYLRSAAGKEVRIAIRPIIRESLDQYRLSEQWESIIKPFKSVAVDKLNLDLPNLIAGVITEKTFEKLAAKEKEVRTNVSARSTALLRNVFSHQW